MARLEDVKRGASVRGIAPDGIVTIVDVQWFGDAAVELTYKGANGHPGNILLYRDQEPTIDIVTTGSLWSFDADGDLLRLVSEAHRIRLAYLFDPLLAVHTSLVEPLPHQISAVYEEMLTRQPLRFLLADDPGAGKTIMTGLLIKELLLRGDLRRCLVVCPGSLVEQWQDELRRRFDLPFEILTTDKLEAAGSGNWFAETPRVIARLDKLSRDPDVQAKLKETDWDLIVCDEAHKMSASYFGNEVKYTKRYHLGQLLSGLTRHFLLLTATPHNGKEADFQLFMGLLDEDRFEGKYRPGVHSPDASDLMRRLVKEQLLTFDGTPLFPERRATTVTYTLSDPEASLYKAVTDYVRDQFNLADALQSEGRKGTVGFALTVLQRRLASSPEAIYQSLRRRRERLAKRLNEEKLLKRGTDAQLDLDDATARAVVTVEDLDDLDDAPDAEIEETEEQIVARAAIMESTGGNPPPVLDPFCGGGSIPLEAQRLGLEAYASDLNPVAVLITKALIEIPPRFAGLPPVNVDDQSRLASQAPWAAGTGMAADVRHYGRWVFKEAAKQIGHLFPAAQLSKETGSGAAPVVAWLWARTIMCPNPACRCQMPLLSTFVLSAKKGDERYLHPVVQEGSITYRIEAKPPLHLGDPKTGFKRGISGIFECACCGTITSRDYVAAEAISGRIGLVQTATVVNLGRTKTYVPAQPDPVVWELPDVDISGLDAQLAENPRDVWCRNFGLRTPADLFTKRQLVALATLVDLVSEARERVRGCAVASGLKDDRVSLDEEGAGATAYADAVTTYLALAISRWSDLSNSLASWNTSNQNVRALFARQAIPMTWDFVELSPFGTLGSPVSFFDSVADLLTALPLAPVPGFVQQRDAMKPFGGLPKAVIVTDPPYYDNIGYADLSDFFYVWLRRSLTSLYPRLFATLLVPKGQELVALPYRFNGHRDLAQRFFENGLRDVFSNMRDAQADDYPLAIFYAFKQSETDRSNGATAGADTVVASTGWETMLDGLLRARFQITGTWPVRTERGKRSVGIGTNALASSIVLVCRPRPEDAPVASRSEFVRALKRELPQALRLLQQGNIAPVDLAQAAIGPGMAIFSRYSHVLEPNGDRLRVRAALGLINQALDEVLAEQEAEYDADTRLAIAWFEQHGTSEGPYGDAEGYAKAKNTTVSGLVEAGILSARAGKVVLLRRDQLPNDWDPTTDRRLTVWEITQHLIRVLDQDGQDAAAALLAQVGSRAVVARDLAYRLYTLCERKGWAQEALAYNSLVVAWPDIAGRASASPGTTVQEQLI